MCATNLWAVNAAAFTPEFERFTEQRLGVAPQVSDLRIASKRIRPSATVFTLTMRMCDCDSLVGRGNDDAHPDEVSAEAWIDWLRDLPLHVPHVNRVAVLRAWSPQEDDVTPAHAKGLRISDIDEEVLRSIGDDWLLTIHYAPTF